MVAMVMAAAGVHAEPLRLIAPANQTVLRGGHFVTLQWEADALGKDVEEWEAFASINGGRYYSVRLTPHLDIAIQHFEVLIPNVDSNDVRFLIRTGNERSETIIELPQRLRIEADLSARFALIGQIVAASPPEAARPDEPPVTLWATGDRNGRGVQFEMAAIPSHVSAQIRVRAEEHTTILPQRARQDAVVLLSSVAPRQQCAHAADHALPTPADVLLLCSRMNI